VGRSNFKQFVNLWEFNSSYFAYLRNSQIFTGTDLNSSPEPYQPHSIPPIGGARYHSGPKNSVPSPLSPPKKASYPKLKDEALEISEVEERFESKMLIYYIYFGTL